MSGIDLLAEVLANEQQDRLWVPIQRATTERGLFRVVRRYMRDTGMDGYDIAEQFEWPPRVSRIFARINNSDSDYPWTAWTDDGHPLTAEDDGVSEFWQVQW